MKIFKVSDNEYRVIAERKDDTRNMDLLINKKVTGIGYFSEYEINGAKRADMGITIFTPAIPCITVKK